MSKGYYNYFPAFSKTSAHQTGRPSFYHKTNESLAHPLFLKAFDKENLAIFHHILNNKIHGIAFSPYIDGQSPGHNIPSQQIEQRINIIKPYVRWIRTFSCVDNNQQIPRLAKEQGLKTLVGVNIGYDRKRNDVEMGNAIKVAESGYADILAIGNEVLLRGDLSEDELIAYIDYAKQALPAQIIGYVDAYFLFENYPRVAEACDVLLVNCYPFWESTAAEYALFHMQDMYQRALNVAQGKKVIIGETGWPNIGTPYGMAVPSKENAVNYFIATYQWAAEEDIDIFYFSSFDELWKTGDEGDVGAHWGLWDSQGNLKY